MTDETSHAKTESGIEDRTRFKSYLFLYNITKHSNFGFMIRTANAFGAEIIIVGKKKYRTHGAVARTRHTPVHHFYTLDQAVEFARKMECTIYGVEIMEQATSITECPFHGNAAFMLGNEGEGLLPWQIEKCDQFVYIPQFGNAVSLNVNVASAICLHRYSDWVGWPECPREGRQFASPESNENMHRRFQEERQVDE